MPYDDGIDMDAISTVRQFDAAEASSIVFVFDNYNVEFDIYQQKP